MVQPGIWLVRHPVVRQLEGICYGRLDAGVDADDEAQAVERTLSMLARESLSAVRLFTSPLKRCAHFAAALCEASVLPFAELLTDADLAEIDFAAWEGRNWSDIDRREIDAWAADPWTYRPGGGECARDVLHRWRRFRRQRLADSTDLQGTGVKPDAGLPTVVVTHAGTIRMALFDAGLLSESALWLHKVPYAEPVWVPLGRPGAAG